MNISVKNLKIKHKEKITLDIEDFKIEGITSLAILGPSGGGKSTLLQTLATIIKPSCGSININGFDISHEAPKEYLQDIGYVFQSNNLFPNLNIIDNIILPLCYSKKMPRKEAIEKAMYWLDRFGIAKHKNKSIHQISGGEQQRACIVRALAMDAKLLMLDEPTSSLDPELSYEIMQMLIELKTAADMILITHELNFAYKFAEHFIFIDHGKIISSQNISSLFENKNQRIKEFVDKSIYK